MNQRAAILMLALLAIEPRVASAGEGPPWLFPFPLTQRLWSEFTPGVGREALVSRDGARQVGWR